jgi:hypothetical protein
MWDLIFAIGHAMDGPRWLSVTCGARAIACGGAGKGSLELGENNAPVG